MSGGGFDEPSLEGLLKQFLGGSEEGDGWGGLDSKSIGNIIQKQHDQNAAAMKKEANLFRDCFLENPAGRKVLEIFLDNTLRKARVPFAVLSTGQNIHDFGTWRDAENAFVAAIVEAIAAAENVEVKARNTI